MLYLEAAIPPGIAPGARSVRLITSPTMATPSIEVKVVAPLPTVTTIISFRNLVDFGTDIEVTGPKSAITLCVVGLDETASVDNVVLQAAGLNLRPAYDVAVRELVRHLLPLAEVVTPNLAEAERLTGLVVRDIAGMEEAARRIVALCETA